MILMGLKMTLRLRRNMPKIWMWIKQNGREIMYWWGSCALMSLSQILIERCNISRVCANLLLKVTNALSKSLNGDVYDHHITNLYFVSFYKGLIWVALIVLWMNIIFIVRPINLMVIFLLENSNKYIIELLIKFSIV